MDATSLARLRDWLSRWIVGDEGSATPLPSPPRPQAATGNFVDDLVGRATLQAERAEAAAGALRLAATGGWFDRPDHPELRRLPDGARAFVGTTEGDFYTVETAGGQAVRRNTIASAWTARDGGINLWEFAKGDGVSDDTAAINHVLALAVSLGVRRIHCGDASRVYLLGGPFLQYGSFPAPGGAVPFNRYKLRLFSNLEIVGEGATFRLAGGARYPGGIFGHPFWTGERLRQVRIAGLVLDGNAGKQIVPPIPAGTHDNSVWQHGNAISGCFDGFEVSGCVFRNLRGHGINFNWASDTPDPWARPQNLEIHGNEFVDVFTQACNAGGENTHFHHNRVHGSGFWVGGLDIESGDPRFGIRNVHAHHNIYDFSDGLSPPEGLARFASNSREARAGRRHTRKAITAYCPGDRYLGTTRDVLIEDETITQGTIYCARFGNVKIRRVTIRNAIPEDLPEGYGPASANAISIAALGWTLPDCEVSDFTVVSPLAGEGIYIGGVQQARIANGTLQGMRGAGIRLEASGGTIADVTVIDAGRDDGTAEPALVGARSSAVVVFGGQTTALTISGITARETRRGTARKLRHALYANVAAAPLTRVTGVTGQNLIGSAVRDVNGTVIQQTR